MKTKQEIALHIDELVSLQAEYAEDEMLAINLNEIEKAMALRSIVESLGLRINLLEWVLK